ncbi:MAG: hypothetical protein PVI86_16700, partial [Phycisphaerae bacterium]
RKSDVCLTPYSNALPKAFRVFFSQESVQITLVLGLVEILALPEMPNGKPLTRRRVPARIAYLTQQERTDPPTVRVLREVHDLTQPREAVARETLATGLLEVWIEVYTERGWGPVAPARSDKADRANGVRLSCRWASRPERTAKRTVLINHSTEDRERSN